MKAYKGLTRYCWAEKATSHFTMEHTPFVAGLGHLFDLGREVSATHSRTQIFSDWQLVSHQACLLHHVIAAQRRCSPVTACGCHDTFMVFRPA